MHAPRMLLALLLLAPAATPAADRPSFAVVVNTESQLLKISDDDLLRIYLGKKTLWEATSTRIQPALLEEDRATAQAFLETTLKKSVSQYRAYWKRLLFSGGGTSPRTFRSSAQVIDFVARQPGGIGIVEASAADSRVKVLEVVN
jgi:ABC-type phosphate transport system substrate-binding protein